MENEELQNEITTGPDAEIPSQAPTDSDSGIGWRIAIIGAVLVVIAFLAYPFLTSGANRSGDDTSSSGQGGPATAEEQFEQGNAHVQAGRLDEAVAAYKKAIEIDPNYQAAYANLGVVYYQQQKFDLAETQYEKALEINSNDGEVTYNLGVLYLQQGLASEQPDKALINQAIELLQRTLELSPDLIEPYFSLGVAYSALGQEEQAIEALETFVEKDTGQDTRASQEAERYLQLLRGGEPE